jgi:hypothetical protein
MAPKTTPPGSEIKTPGTSTSKGSSQSQSPLASRGGTHVHQPPAKKGK